MNVLNGVLIPGRETNKLLGESAKFMRILLQIRVPFRVLFIRVPYSLGDLKRDPNLENYWELPMKCQPIRCKTGSPCCLGLKVMK